jgi:hypothetical protein
MEKHSPIEVTERAQKPLLDILEAQGASAIRLFVEGFG